MSNIGVRHMHACDLYSNKYDTLNLAPNYFKIIYKFWGSAEIKSDFKQSIF